MATTSRCALALALALAATTAAIGALSISACAIEPLVERTRTTLGEVDLTGLECRDEAVMGSLRKRTICASPEQWAAYDEEERRKAEDIQRDIRRQGSSVFFRQ